MLFSVVGSNLDTSNAANLAQAKPIITANMANQATALGIDPGTLKPAYTCYKRMGDAGSEQYCGVSVSASVTVANNVPAITATLNNFKAAASKQSFEANDPSSLPIAPHDGRELSYAASNFFGDPKYLFCITQASTYSMTRATDGSYLFTSADSTLYQAVDTTSLRYAFKCEIHSKTVPPGYTFLP